jgi:hypothetical protein
MVMVGTCTADSMAPADAEYPVIAATKLIATIDFAMMALI